MHTYSTICIGESIHSFSFVLISSSAVLFALCPFINVIRWKTLHCIYCFLPVRSSPFPFAVTVLFEFRKMWNYSLAPFVLLLLQLLLLVPPGRDIRRPRKLPAIATKAAGRQQRNESKNLQLAGPAERERERREDEQEVKERDRGRGWGWAAARTWARTPGKLTHLDYKHNCHTCLHKCWQDCLISFN